MKNLSILLSCILIGSIGNAQDLKLSKDNLDEIIANLTLEEKARLLVGRENSESDNGVPGAAGVTQDIPRLGIPSIVLTDGPAGVRISPKREGDSQTYYATGFPVGTALASSWNTDLVEEIGNAIGDETHEYGCDVLLAPGVNIHRTPLCGRNFEYYSEDPVVAGKIAAAYINGVQKNDVGTSLKHFAVNSQETNRIEVDEVVTPRALREIYLKPFEIVISESNPWTVMSSYNKINGTWTQSSPELLLSILRDDWGYDGLVMTDWTNERRPSAERIAAGNSLLTPGHDWQEIDIIENVNNGNLSITEVDREVRRLLELIVKTPRFNKYKFSNKPDLESHAALTRQAATEGMVLLENKNNTLPLKETGKVALFGKTSYDFTAGGTGSGDVNKPYVIDLRTGLQNAGFKIDPKLEAYYEANKNLIDKTNAISGERNRTEEKTLSKRNIEKLAQQNDFAIYTLGRQAGEGSDRTIDRDFNISPEERTLINDIASTFHAYNKPLIVIMNIGAPVEVESWKNIPDAILLAWQPGQEGGNSVADVLTGKTSPSGKLTMTFPITAADVPAVNNFPTGSGPHNRERGRNYDYTLHEEDIYVGYRYFNTFNKPVSYPFGYGLSYTTFDYSKPVIKPTKDGFTAQITVTNTGEVPAKEIIQLYVEAPETSLPKPKKELKAFAKTKELNPGESQILSFEVKADDLASFNSEKSQWETAPGKYKILLGASSDDIKNTLPYSLKKEIIRPTSNVLNLQRELKTIR